MSARERIGVVRAGACAAALLCVVAAPAAAASVADFYSGRTINLVIGLPVGSAFDAYGRLIARHIGDHIPGKPSIVAQNMPGAGGMVAANYIYNTAPKDGSVFGSMTATPLFEPLLGDKQALFDAAKFDWLGSASQSVYFCVLGPSSKMTSFDQWSKSGKELTFAASGPTAGTYKDTMVLKNVLGASLRTITGYSGVATSALAVERGEADGICGVPSTTLAVQFKSQIDSGQFTPIMQMGARRDDAFGKVPSIFDFAKTDEQKQILSFAFEQLALGKPFMAPPGLPDDRFEALKAAFAETLKDTALLADSKQAKLNIEYLSGEDAKKLLKKIADYPPAVLAKAKQVLGE
jgi:tripartite-type tricarboxylate transporter receptor subunit TctC